MFVCLFAVSLSTLHVFKTVLQPSMCVFSCRCGEQGMMPLLNRSMSVPDTGSLWDMHTSASQPAGAHTKHLKCHPFFTHTLASENKLSFTHSLFFEQAVRPVYGT